MNPSALLSRTKNLRQQLDGIESAMSSASASSQVAGALNGQDGIVILDDSALNLRRYQVTLDGDTDDLNAAGFNWLVLSTDADCALSGVSGGQDGATLWLTNDSEFAVTLTHDDDSVEVNRFLCPGATDFTLPAGGSVPCIYDGAEMRYRVVAQSSVAAGSFSGAIVYQPIGSTLLSGSGQTYLEFEEDTDFGGYHDDGTNPERLTIAEPGLYLVGYDLYWTDSVGDPDEYVNVIIHHTDYASIAHVITQDWKKGTMTGAGGYNSSHSSALVHLEDTDFLRVGVDLSGTTGDVVIAPGARFWITRMD